MDHLNSILYIARYNKKLLFWRFFSEMHFTNILTAISTGANHTIDNNGPLEFPYRQAPFHTFYR